jgi:hypothetical protein
MEFLDPGVYSGVFVTVSSTTRPTLVAGNGWTSPETQDDNASVPASIGFGLLQHLKLINNLVPKHHA